MRRALFHVALAALIGLAALEGYEWYKGIQTEDTSPYPGAMLNAKQLVFDEDLVTRMDRDAYRLTLLADEGTEAYVLVWDVEGAQVRLNQIVFYDEGTYTGLLVNWRNGSTTTYPVEVNLRKPVTT